MANTTMDVLIPEIWAARWSELKMGQYPFATQNVVSRNLSNEIASYGDQVNVMVAPDMGEAVAYVPGANTTQTGITQTSKSLILNESWKQSILLTRSELSTSPYALIDKYTPSLLKSLLRKIELKVYLESLKTSNFINWASITTLDEDDVMDARKSLSSNECDLSNLHMVLGPDDYTALSKLDAYQHFNVTGDVNVMNDGRIVKKNGFQFHESNIISTYTPVDLVGEQNDAAGSAIGVTTMIVDGFNDDTIPIRAGDMFYTEDDGSTVPYTVTSTSTTTSDTTTLNFLPALVLAAEENDDITFVASRSMVGLDPRAVELAIRPYYSVPSEFGAKSMVVNFMGIPIGLSIYQFHLDVVVQADVLFGVKMIDPNKVVRIIRA